MIRLLAIAAAVALSGCASRADLQWRVDWLERQHREQVELLGHVASGDLTMDEAVWLMKSGIAVQAMDSLWRASK